MTPAQLAPHQVPVTGVTLRGRIRGVTGAWTLVYQAPDGEVIEIAAGRRAEPETRRYAIEVLNQRRTARADRIARNDPVTCLLALPAGLTPV